MHAATTLDAALERIDPFNNPAARAHWMHKRQPKALPEFSCGCHLWRPKTAGDDWHLVLCGRAPAPAFLRYV